MVVAPVLVLLFPAWSLYVFHVFHITFLCLLIFACACICVRLCASHICVMSAHVLSLLQLVAAMPSYVCFPCRSSESVLCASCSFFLEPSTVPCARSYPFHAPSMPYVSDMSAYAFSCLSYGSSCGFRGCPFSMCMRCPYEIGRDSWVRGGQVSVVLKNSPLNGGRSSHQVHMEHKRKRSVPWIG